MAEERLISIFMKDGSLWELPVSSIAGNYADHVLREEEGLSDKQIESIKDGSDGGLRETWVFERDQFLNLEALEEDTLYFIQNLSWLDIKEFVRCVKKPDPNKLTVSKEWVLNHFPRDKMTIGSLKEVFNNFNRYIDKYAEDYIKKMDYSLALKEASFDLILD